MIISLNKFANLKAFEKSKLFPKLLLALEDCSWRLCMKTLKFMKEFSLMSTQRSLGWLKFEKQEGRMRKRSAVSRRGRRSKKTKKPDARLARARKRWVSWIWLDTVLAGERKGLTFKLM